MSLVQNDFFFRKKKERKHYINNNKLKETKESFGKVSNNMGIFFSPIFTYPHTENKLTGYFLSVDETPEHDQRSWPAFLTSPPRGCRHEQLPSVYTVPSD